jgi:hypothetical protein
LSERKPLPRSIRGPRPAFYADPAVDKLLSTVLQLAAEVWTLRERVAAMEAIARDRGALAPGEVDAHEFSADDEARLEAQRAEFLASILRPLEAPTSRRSPEPGES